ncbi:salivary sulfotransferase, putative [Ixodes scapularis]|uniref:Salivary sulfotransferase, putative n=1 Tax=Ixodes scapularis TaxID=6945 RepID=B7Q1I2_IXOSC|nr:salivary sulfotransferase, putative [Ixodes scapularis]|eukprot:XP_002409696.1 salivary sulfotransferase, putative [Ixodes scapularis]
MNGSKRVPATQLINGEACSAYYSPTSYMEALEFEPREGDIIEVTFTRSGTHLVQQMIQLILNKGQSTKTFAEFNKRAPFLEVQGLREASGAPRLLRTHLPMNRLRLSDEAKYVYVARNPWDCCVSNFHLMQDFPLFEFADGTFDDFLDTFLDGRFGFGDYFDHIISGYDHKHDANVFFVTYEEICRDKVDVVHRLARFLGEEYGDMVRSDSALLKLILERSSVEFMKNLLRTDPKEMSQVFTRANVPIISTAEASQDTKEAKCSFVRKGTVGGWKSYFSPEIVAKMQHKIDEKFKGTDIMMLWMNQELADKH